MGKKFSLDKQYEIDELEKYLDNLSTEFNLKIVITEEGGLWPDLELSGRYSREQLCNVLKQRRLDLYASGQKDELTGMLNREYFYKRLSTVDRSMVVPVAVINININDWKFHNDNFGDEGSDNLIKTVAGIISSEAKPYFVCGRIDGDVFAVLIPMVMEGEAEDFVARIKNACEDFDSPYLAPSVACGIVIKTNIEENIEDLLSDAEYIMFEDKFKVKNKEGYKERLERLLKNK